MVEYINHIIWRYIDNRPNQYRLLDVRHNVMKNLIVGDCKQLIKFILFESDGKVKINHIPRNKSWKRKEDRYMYINNDDLDPFDRQDSSKDFEKIIPRNDMELAIYHCKGKL